MSNLASYIYSTYSRILTLPKEELHEVGYHTNESSPIPSFDQNLLISLCQEAQSTFSKENIVLEIYGDFIVVGDIHGSLHDLLRILNYINEQKMKALFLGDYVDRGNFSLECITLLFAMKILFPDNFFLLRGNHEFDIICSTYGFKKEIITIDNSMNDSQNFENKNGQEIDYFISHSNKSTLRQYQYDESLYKAFLRAFSYLPVCAVINKSSICIHGGISPKLTKIEDIKNVVRRPVDNFDNELLCDLLWGDPSKRASQIANLFDENPRGKGKLFSGIAISDFLKNNFLKRLIRGHECVNQGTEIKFNEKCITVFSASSYNKEMGNKSGILKVIKNGDSIESVTFPPLVPLNRGNVNFFRVQPFFEKCVPGIPSKPFFTMTSTRPPIGKTQSERQFMVKLKPENCNLKDRNRLNSSLNVFPSADGNSAPRQLGLPFNRKPKTTLNNNIRNVNGSFAFNTGIQQRRLSSASCLTEMQKKLYMQQQNHIFQSDNQAEMEVDKMEHEEKEIEIPNQTQKVLPKLVAKS